MKSLPIITLLVIAVSLIALGGDQAHAAGCDTVVTAPALIQDAIDLFPGGNVCLDDSGGVFDEAVVLGPVHSGTTLMAEPGDSPIMDGGLRADSAITLLGGVTNVTIDGLEIKKYGVDGTIPRFDGIIARDGATSQITIRNNYLHELSGTGVNAGSDGSFTHDNWIVESNLVSENDFRGITLNNTSHSKVVDNFVRNNGDDGILIEARQSLAAGDVLVEDVQVKGNDVRDSGDDGIRLRARVTGGGTARITDIHVTSNSSQFSFDDGISVQARDTGAAADQVSVTKNLSQFNDEEGIQVQARGLGVTVDDVKVEENIVPNNRDGIRIHARNGGTVDQVSVTKNVMSNNSRNGILVLVGSAGTVHHASINENVLVNNSHHGVNFFAADSGIISQSTVSRNRANGNTFMGIFFGAIDSGVVTENKVEKNVAEDNDIHGIGLFALFENSGGIVTDNQVFNNTANQNASTGISLTLAAGGLSVDGNMIKGNSATGNGADGFSANTGAGVNIFEKNKSNLNGLFGYLDAAVANIYTQNQCNFNASGGSSPLGLCSP